MNDIEPDEGICPNCSHVNKGDWQLCDACGQRLPWAKTKPPKKKISELSTEELEVLFAPPRDLNKPWYLNRLFLIVVATIVSGVVFQIMLAAFR